MKQQKICLATFKFWRALATETIRSEVKYSQPELVPLDYSAPKLVTVRALVKRRLKEMKPKIFYLAIVENFAITVSYTIKAGSGVYNQALQWNRVTYSVKKKTPVSQTRKTVKRKK